jgi:hypothetical protein
MEKRSTLCKRGVEAVRKDFQPIRREAWRKFGVVFLSAVVVTVTEHREAQVEWENMKGKVEEIVGRLIPKREVGQPQVSWWGPDLEKLCREAGRAHRA